MELQNLVLTEREEQVLEAVVRNYILTATPTGSRFLSKQKDFNLSAASIRNIMGDLEEKGLVTQPHTSAGRIPTDKGYRYYVDRVMKLVTLPQKFKNQIRKELTQIETSDLHMLLEVTSKALSKATDQLGVILSPKFQNSVFRHLHIHKVGNNRYLMMMTVDSGFVKTIVVELGLELEEKKIENVCQLINERYYGLTLQKIFETREKIFSDIDSFELGIIRLFIPSIQRILEKGGSEEVFAEGKTKILLKPEFFNKEQVSSIIEILEEKNMLMHLFGEEQQSDNHVVITIGGEIEHGIFSSFSVVKTVYRIGHMQGSLGIIGPKRMPYPFLVSAVDYTSKLLGNLYT